MVGSDFSRIPFAETLIIVAIVAYTAIVIALWELAKTAWPHVHLYWK